AELVPVERVVPLAAADDAQVVDVLVGEPEDLVPLGVGRDLADEVAAHVVEHAHAQPVLLGGGAVGGVGEAGAEARQRRRVARAPRDREGEVRVVHGDAPPVGVGEAGHVFGAFWRASASCTASSVTASPALPAMMALNAPA